MNLHDMVDPPHIMFFAALVFCAGELLVVFGLWSLVAMPEASRNTSAAPNCTASSSCPKCPIAVGTRVQAPSPASMNHTNARTRRHSRVER